MKITQIPSGRWLVRISYQQDGKTKEMSKTFAKRREAERYQRQHEAARDGGTLRPLTRDTVGQYLARWLRDLTGVGGRTREDYENIVRRYLGRNNDECRAITERYRVEPALGARRLSGLTPPMVRESLASLTRAGLAPRTVAYARAVLRRALNQAVADGIIPANPAAGRGLVPKEVRAEVQVLTAAEVKRVLTQTGDDPLHALWVLLLTGGMRLSEALGLRWADVSLGNREVSVVRKLRRPADGGPWVLEECKTEKSRRTIHVPATTAEAMIRHRDRQGAERLTAGDGYRDHGFVFADDRGEPLRGDGVTKYAWKPMLARLGLPAVKLHAARHTCATLLFEAGQEMKDVQEILGHSSIVVTADIYSHVSNSRRRQSADALAELLGRAEI